MSTTKTFIWKDPSRITLAVTIIMAVDIVCGIVGLVLQLVWGEVGHFGMTPIFMLRTPRALILAYSCLSLAALLSTPVLVFWTLRASKNAHVLKGRPLANSPLFAALWWYVIPLMFLFKPVEAMGEIWDASASTSERRKDRRFVLRLWWGSFLVTIIAGDLALALGRDSILITVQLAVSIVECGAFSYVARHIRDVQLEKHLGMMFSDETPKPVSVLERLNV